jgi:iron complex outermembrane recepter protein
MKKVITLLMLCFSAAVSAQHNDKLEEVTVTARPDGFQNASHIAQGLTVLSGDELKEKLNNSIGETLAGELGVSASDFGQGASRPVIRGLGGARVKIMQDGIASLDVSTVSVDHPVTIDPAGADQIEILRGPSTLLYGSGAFGGLVNVSTNRIASKLHETFSASLDTRFNTVSDAISVGLKAAGSTGPLALHFDTTVRDSNDYEAADGTIENSAVESNNLNFGISVIGEDGYLGASFGRYDSVFGIPLNPDEADERVSIDQNQDRFDISGQLNQPLDWLRSAKVRLGYVDYEHTEFENPGEPGTRFYNNEWEGRVELNHKPLARWNGTVGFQYRNRRFNSIGEEAFVPATKLDSYGVFVLQDTDRDDWHFELGARYERQVVEPTNTLNRFEIEHEVYSLSAGAILEFRQDYDLGFSATRAQRAPSIEELLASGPHLASATYEEGDIGLSEETSNNLEINLRKAAGRWRWTANVFVNYIEDFVYQREQDENNDGIADEVDKARALGGELLLIRYIQQNALFYGIEAETHYELFDNDDGKLGARLWGDWVHAELSNGENLPRISPPRIGLSLEYNRNDWHADLDLTHILKQDQNGNLETQTAGYNMLEIGLGYSHQFNQMGLDLSLRGKNLLDEDARRHTSFLKDRAPLPGRAVLLGLQITY